MGIVCKKKKKNQCFLPFLLNYNWYTEMNLQKLVIFRLIYLSTWFVKFL